MIKTLEKDEFQIQINLTWDKESQLFTPLLLVDAITLMKLNGAEVLQFSAPGVNKPGYNSVDQLDKALNLNHSRKVQILLHNFNQEERKKENSR